jgi:hypothetical protein
MAPVTRSQTKRERERFFDVGSFAPPASVMELIADLASPVAVLNLQLVNRAWATACKGKLRKHAEDELGDLLETSRAEVIELLEKNGDWTHRFSGRYLYFAQQLECSPLPVQVFLESNDVLDDRASEERTLENIYREWDRAKAKDVDYAVISLLTYSMASLPARDFRDFAERALRRPRFYLYGEDSRSPGGFRFGFNIAEKSQLLNVTRNYCPRRVWRYFFAKHRGPVTRIFEQENRDRMRAALESEIGEIEFSLR